MDRNSDHRPQSSVDARSFVSRLPANRYAVFSLLVLVGLAWDLYTKHAVFADLGYPGGNPVVRGAHELFASPPGRHGQSRLYFDGWVRFRLYTSFNEGALWGMGQGLTWLFASLSVVAMVFVIYWLFIRSAARSLWLTSALGLITAGTLGNLFDRLGLHGYSNPQADGRVWYAVRDFLHFQFGEYHWPVFNFADTFLVTGAIMLILQSLRTPTCQPESTDESLRGSEAEVESGNATGPGQRGEVKPRPCRPVGHHGK